MSTKKSLNQYCDVDSCGTEIAGEPALKSLYYEIVTYRTGRRLRYEFVLEADEWASTIHRTMTFSLLLHYKQHSAARQMPAGLTQRA